MSWRYVSPKKTTEENRFGRCVSKEADATASALFASVAVCFMLMLATIGVVQVASVSGSGAVCFVVHRRRWRCTTKQTAPEENVYKYYKNALRIMYQPKF